MIMTIETAIEQLNAIKDRQKNNNSDQEADHSDADRILLNVIADQGVWDAYDAINKWYA